MENFEDFKTAVGFGMGTSKMDNELIEEAFVMGAGAATGMAIAYLNLEPSLAHDMSVEIFRAVQMVTGENGE